MFRVALKGLLQRKSRLLGTVLAIVLGVGFISGIYVLTDTIKKTFDDLFGSVYAGTDVVVQPKTDSGGRLRNQTNRLDPAMLTTVKGVDGVEAAYGFIREYAQAVAADGQPVGGENAPAFGFSWSDDHRVNPFSIADGRAPVEAGEVAIDRTSFKTAKLKIGQTISVLSLGKPADFTVVGVMKFGTADSAASASVLSFAGDHAAAAMHTEGKFSQILVVAKPGVSQDALAARISPLVAAPKIEVLTGIDATEQRRSDLRDRLNGVTTALLIFGYLALFVGAFVIVNTFAIVVAQRRQELALLRAVGASRRQVGTSVVTEAALIGLVAALIGIVVGIGIAQALKALFGAFGFSLPTGAVVLLPRTIVVALIAGIVVTVLASLFPAWRAASVPPVAAMRESAIEVQRASRPRVIAGLACFAIAAWYLYDGLAHHQGNPAAKEVGYAGGATLIAAALLGPVLMLAFAKVTRRLLRARGVSAELAAENVARSPRRSAVTGFALTLGLSIVAALLVFAASFKGLLDNTVQGQFKGDYVITTTSFIGFSSEVAKTVRATPGIEAASAFRFGFDAAKPTTGDKRDDSLVAVDTSSIDQVVAVPMSAGRMSAIGTGQMVIGDDEAKKRNVGVGDRLTFTFPTGDHELEIVGLLDSAKGAGIFQGVTRIVSLETWDAFVNQPLDSLVIAKADGKASLKTKKALVAALKPYATTRVLDQAAYKQFVLKQVNGFLGFIFVMLFLSIIIAAVGVWNTLNLSVIERTREIGVLRGVGMARRQVRAMVRWESVLIALYGALLGLTIGVAFGIALVRALRSQGFTVIAVPWLQLLAAIVVAFLLGLAAAVGAARRAAKLDILRAIAVA